MILWLLLWPLFLGIISIVSPTTGRRWIGVLGASVYVMLATFALKQVYLEGPSVVFMGEWPAPFGITMVADLFSTLMILVTGVIYLACMVYLMGEVANEKEEHFRFLHSLAHFMIFGVSGAFLTGDYFNMYVWYEVMILSSFGLLLMTDKKHMIDGIIKYALLNFLASSFFLIGLALLYGHFGTLNIADVTVKARTLGTQGGLVLPCLFMAFGFFMKAGGFPLFAWLPSSYHLPLFSISALFAGLLTKVGLYSLMRLMLMSFPGVTEILKPYAFYPVALTMIFGVLGAVASYDTRKILSFHIISQVGYMLSFLVWPSPMVVAMIVFYIIHHILVKSNLFLIAGHLKKHQGIENLKNMGGHLKSFPLVAVGFMVAGFSLGGIPPFSGFWAKFGLIKGLMAAQSYGLILVALLVGVLTLFSMVKIWFEGFVKSAPKDSGEETLMSSGDFSDANYLKLLTAKEAPSLLSILGLAGCTLFLSLQPQGLLKISQEAAERILNPQSYIEKVFPQKGEEP